MTKPTKTPKSPPSPLDQRHYTTDEAAAVLRTNERAVRVWIAQGTIAAARPGRSYLIPESEIRRLLAPVAGTAE